MSDVLLDVWRKHSGTLWIKMLAECHTSRDIKRHGCCLHDQDMGWVNISGDMQNVQRHGWMSASCHVAEYQMKPSL